MTSDFDSSISRKLHRNSSRHTHRLSGTLDVTPFLHGSDFTLLADTSLTHSFHTPQSPMSVHATCLHLVCWNLCTLTSLVTHTKLNSNASFTIADVVSTALRTPYSANVKTHSSAPSAPHNLHRNFVCFSRLVACLSAVQALCNLSNLSGQVLELHRLDNAINRHSDIIPRLSGFDLFSCRTSRIHRITLHHSKSTPSHELLEMIMLGKHSLLQGQFVGLLVVFAARRPKPLCAS